MARFQKRIQVQAKARVPRVPNFIMLEDGDTKIRIGDINDAGLKNIGKEWTINLLERAKEQREQDTNDSA